VFEATEKNWEELIEKESKKNKKLETLLLEHDFELNDRDRKIADLELRLNFLKLESLQTNVI